MHLKVHTAIIMNQKISDIQLYDKVRVACWDLDEKAAVKVVCEIEEQGGSGLPIKVTPTPCSHHHKSHNILKLSSKEEWWV